MSTPDVRRIAKDGKEDVPLRALAWRELRWRNPAHRQPIVITDGARPDGTLIVHEFATREQAAAAGYPWAGHDMTVNPDTLIRR